MKKSIFIFAALFAATFANAQIYLEATFIGRVKEYFDVTDYYFDCGKLPIIYGDSLVELYNDDMTLYKTIRFTSSSVQTIKRATTATKGGPSYGTYLFSRNIFTTDGKVAFIKWSSDKVVVYDEDKTLLATIPIEDNYPDMGLFSVNGKWKLIIQESRWSEITYTSTYTTYIYSLPGNGDTQAISTLSSPKRSSSARKIARDGQVLVETNTSTYTLTGQEVK